MVLKHDERENNFDFLRLVAALMVVFAHSFALLLVRNEPLYIATGYIDFGMMGVIIFFVISGFLISKSWTNNPSLIKFYWNRLLRIVPGLLFVTCITIFIIGPLVTSFTLIDYFKSSETWTYFRVVTILGIIPHTPNLPGVFQNNPYRVAVNGSLWSLPIEFGMYILISVIGLLKFLKRKYSILITCIIIIFVFSFSKMNTSLTAFTNISSIINTYSSFIIYPIFFLVGVLHFLFRETIKLKWSVSLVFLIVWILSFKTVFFYLMSMMCLPYIILTIANIRIPYLNIVTKHGDLSYGIYIFAFPIQQTIIHYEPSISVTILITISTFISILAAFISWRYVESKALQMKKYDPIALVKSFFL